MVSPKPNAIRPSDSRLRNELLKRGHAWNVIHAADIPIKNWSIRPGNCSRSHTFLPIDAPESYAFIHAIAPIRQLRTISTIQGKVRAIPKREIKNNKTGNTK